LREFKMSNSVASGNAFIIGNGGSPERARWHFPFISLSCLASNGSRARAELNVPPGTYDKAKGQIVAKQR
jgi:hypothetical protein